jgi:predicted RNA-binding protein with PUA-like domain
MAYWLLKTEPSDYSYADLERDGSTVWDGVGNNLALKHMREVHKGDEAFIYHTGSERQIVGIAEIISDPYPDPGRPDTKRVVFDVRPRRRLANSVTLRRVKDDPTMRDFDLVRISRLSVMPVSPDRWRKLLRWSEDGD